jgi:putative peptidoglycan lipid II flippase
LTVPASALLFVLAAPLVTFLLQSGRFNAHGTLMTASALRFYSLGIFAWSAQAILTRGFYALQDTRTPVLSGSVMTVIFIAMNWLVVNASDMGVGGLALATTIAATLHMLVMYVLLRRRLGGLNGAALFGSVVKTLLATAALSLLAWLLRVALDTVLPGGLTPKLHAAIILAVAGGLGIGAFYVVARALRMSELQSVLDMIQRKRKKA